MGTNQLTSLSDLELLIALCSQQDDEKVYSEFVKRFLPDVKEECIKIGNRRNVDKHISIQIAHDTFEKARKYKTFKEDEIKLRDSRKAILVYLFRIAINLFNDHYKKEKKQKENFHHKTYFDELISSDGLPTDPKNLLRIKEMSLAILNKLNSKEKAVVLADLEYKKHHLYLPDDVNERLANELGVKKESVRKIRERAINKIKKAIDEINEE